MSARQRIFKTVDPTHDNLVLAVLDQHVAGAFRGKRIAYHAVVAADGPGFGLGVVQENEPGYWPVPAEAFHTDDWGHAQCVADGMNLHIGVSDKDAAAIVSSSMRIKEKDFKGYTRVV